jgi:hypothetical protein
MGVKSNALGIASIEPGVCGQCRHSNQGTVDFAEGHVFCSWTSGARHRNYGCDVRMSLPRDRTSGWTEYYLFEPFDTTNGTWGRLQDSRLLAPAASPQQRAALQADVPFIPADE